MAEQKKLSIIAFSGDFDKLTAVFTLGTGAAAVGYEVNIFFTFWGLDAIKQKQGRSFTGGNWLTKLFGFMMGGLKVTPTSRFNFLGVGPKAQEQRGDARRTGRGGQGARNQSLRLRDGDARARSEERRLHPRGEGRARCGVVPQSQRRWTDIIHLKR